MASLGELFIELGVLGDDEGAKKVAKSLDDVIDKATKAAKQLNKQDKSTKEVNKSSVNAASKIALAGKNIGLLISAIGGAVIALNKLADSLVQQNQYWINLVRNSNVALSTYQKWGSIGAVLDKSLGMEGAAGALKQLNDQIFEYRLTGQNAEGFLFAGIMPTNAEDVMEQLRDRVAGMDDNSASYILRKLGLDERMLPLLRMSRKEFEALNKELEKYRLTPEQRQTIQDFHKQMSIVNQKMQYFKDRILVAIMPHLARFMEFIVKIIEKLPKYRGLIIGVGVAISKGFGKWLKALPLIGKHLNPIVKLLQKMRIFQKGLFRGLTGFLTKLPFIGGFFGKLGGIISKAFLPLTAAYLLLEDFWVWQQGGESVIGDVINYFKDMGEDWLNIGKIFTTKPLLAFKAALVKIGDIFIKIAQGILNAIDAILGTPLGKWFRKLYGGEDYDANMEQLRENLRESARLIDEEKLTAAAVPSSITNNNDNNDNSKEINITQNNSITTTQPMQTLNQQLGLVYTNALFGN